MAIAFSPGRGPFIHLGGSGRHQRPGYEYADPTKTFSVPAFIYHLLRSTPAAYFLQYLLNIGSSIPAQQTLQSAGQRVTSSSRLKDDLSRPNPNQGDTVIRPDQRCINMVKHIGDAGVLAQPGNRPQMLFPLPRRL